ncbi:conserved fungal protein [Gigaspora margarita]|uniref:Conserved fungal protein n=1 Tax=Gigaspora margarita TaxID=4874 RepID=A0A8H4A1Y0_GIGMA|nr:conserved fungal protein [Gigaspora margarita]
MSHKLPPKDDPVRASHEQDALKAAERASQFAGALKEGKIPTTQQITTAIETIQDSDAMHNTSRGMSPLGKKVFADTEKFLESTKTLLVEKNANDELQNTVYYGAKAAREIKENTSSIPEDLRQKIDEHLASAEPSVKAIWQKTLLIPQLLISSPEFRRLVNDINHVIQEALQTSVPGHEDRLVETPPEDEEKHPREFAEGLAQQGRESVFPVAKAGAELIGPHIKSYGEGSKSLREAGTEGMKNVADSVRTRVTAYKLSPTKRERIVNRFKSLMFEVQQSPEFQEALSDLIDVISKVSTYTQDAHAHVVETAKGQSQDIPSFQLAQENAKSLIENFSNNKSLDDLIDALKEMGTQVKNHEELRNYLRDLRHFVLSSLRDKEFVERTDYKEYGSRLIEDGRRILLDNYGNFTERVTYELSAFNEAIQEDQTTQQWTKDLECLVRDIFLDEKGRPTIKFELVKDFGKILSIVAEKLKFIPLPRMENYDDNYEFCFDNIVLHVSDILPKHLHISVTSDINLDREGNDVVQNTGFFEISKLRADARNIAFYFKKKGGLIQMRDVGLVDFAVPADGMRFYMRILLDMPNADTQFTQFRVLEADTKISELKIRLHDTKRDFLYTLITPLAEKRIKRQIENLITEQMKKAVAFIQEKVARVQTQINELQKRKNSMKATSDNEDLNSQENRRIENHHGSKHATKA